MAFAIRRIEKTPNPNAIKCVLDRRITARTQSYSAASPLQSNDPLARALLAIPGVAGVMFCDDFVTISKRPEARWDGIEAQARLALSAAVAGPGGEGF